MATPYLPSVDAAIKTLGSIGEDTSLRARQKRFETLGLDKRLGAFIGTPSQNDALVRAVQSERKALGKLPANMTAAFTEVPDESKASPFANLFGAFAPLLSGFKSPTITEPGAIQTKMPQITPQAPAPITPVAPFTPTPKTPTATEATSTLGVKSAEAQAPTAQALETVGQPRVVSLATGAQAEVDSQGNILRIVKEAPVRQEVALAGGDKVIRDETGGVKTLEEVRDADTKDAIGFSASDVLPGSPDEMTLFNDFLNSQDFALMRDRLELQGLTVEGQAEAAKQELEQRYEQERKSVEEQLGRAGLFMSGIRSTQIKALADKLATSELNVDRQLASKLLDMNLDLREGILKGVTELVKQAKDKNKDAIEQLNKVGLAVVGNKLVPTVESIREERLGETADIQNEIKQLRLQLDQSKDDLQRQNLLSQIEKRTLEMQLIEQGGGYTPQEVRRLRNEGIDTSDTESADAFLYDKQLLREPTDAEYNRAISLLTSEGGIASLEKLTGKSGRNAVAQFIVDTPSVEIDGNTFRLTNTAKKELLRRLEETRGGLTKFFTKNIPERFGEGLE